MLYVANTFSLNMLDGSAVLKVHEVDGITGEEAFGTSQVGKLCRSCLNS